MFDIIKNYLCKDTYPFTYSDTEIEYWYDFTVHHQANIRLMTMREMPNNEGYTMKFSNGEIHWRKTAEEMREVIINLPETWDVLNEKH